MAIRTFLFCDRCNPDGVRAITDKSHPKRRNSDDRSWFEGTPEEAKKEGWKISSDRHLCSRCATTTSQKSPPKLTLIKSINDKK